MSPGRVLLVGYEDQDNLGLRYLASRLAADGHEVRIARFGADPAPLVAEVGAWRPTVVGFSLIFQFMTHSYATVIRAVRATGVPLHLTVGGHYPSFSPDVMFELVPELDSVVRFEGEETLAELVGHLQAGREWRASAGIAWSDGARVHTTAPRGTPVDLDALPWPDRADLDYRAQSMPTASVLASRGCPWKCSFCSIITFYEQNGTRGRRRRDPVRVVDELEHLVRDRGVRLVLFQDDDFLAGGRAALEWATAIATDIRGRGLHERMRFKLSCRSDEVRADVLAPLVAAGLAHVYLGVESGDPGALKDLNKHITPDVHLRAGEVLRSLGLAFDFGFMLLQPWSTLASVANNVTFLRRFCRDGYAVAGFCRTLPYVGTPMEKKMRDEGRLVGHALEADYQFLDPRLDALWDFSLAAFDGRNTGRAATWNVLRTLQFEARLDFPDRPRDPSFVAAVQSIVDASNQLMFDVLDDALAILEDAEVPDARHPDLVELARAARAGDLALRQDLTALWSVRPPSVGQELFR